MFLWCICDGSFKCMWTEFLYGIEACAGATMCEGSFVPLCERERFAEATVCEGNWVVSCVIGKFWEQHLWKASSCEIKGSAFSDRDTYASDDHKFVEAIMSIKVKLHVEYIRVCGSDSIRGLQDQQSRKNMQERECVKSVSLLWIDCFIVEWSEGVCGSDNFY